PAVIGEGPRPATHAQASSQDRSGDRRQRAASQSRGFLDRLFGADAGRGDEDERGGGTSYRVFAQRLGYLRKRGTEEPARHAEPGDDVVEPLGVRIEQTIGFDRLLRLHRDLPHSEQEVTAVL